jgi:molybdopterin converting factor small subunit
MKTKRTRLPHPDLLKSVPNSGMTIRIQFFSWFKDLTGCAETTEPVPEGCTLGELRQKMLARFPRLVPMEKSMLMAVGVDYQTRDYVLKAGDDVSLFPPVQGG